VIPLAALARWMLTGVASHPPSSACSQEEIAGWDKESDSARERGRVRGFDGTNPVAKAPSIVREVKHSFPDPHLVDMHLGKGKVVAQLRVDRDEHTSFARLKPGVCDFELGVPAGKPGTKFLGFGSSSDKRCASELQVTRVEDVIILTTRRL
jgi:hypothetical protein